MGRYSQFIDVVYVSVAGLSTKVSNVFLVSVADTSLCDTLCLERTVHLRGGRLSMVSSHATVTVSTWLSLIHI